MSTFRKRIWRDRLNNLTFYQNVRFALIDLSFGLIRLFINPYRTCRKYLQKRGEENIYAYGETPYLTYQRITEICQVGPQDTWIEMGAGRGKGCFWLAHFVGCRVVGVEWIPQFVWIAKMINRLLGSDKISFKRQNMQDADLEEGTFIYLYGHWPKVQIPSFAYVITISEPLEGLTVLKKFWVRYPWGRTTAFLQKK